MGRFAQVDVVAGDVVLPQYQFPAEGRTYVEGLEGAPYKIRVENTLQLGHPLIAHVVADGKSFFETVGYGQSRDFPGEGSFIFTGTNGVSVIVALFWEIPFKDGISPGDIPREVLKICYACAEDLYRKGVMVYRPDNWVVEPQSVAHS